MADYERTTTRRTTDEVDTAEQTVVTGPGTAYVERSAPPRTHADQVSTTETTTVARPGADVMLRRVITLLFGILQALLILRIILLLLVANRDNPVVELILVVTDPFVEPFRGMFQLDSIASAAGSVFDVAALVALIGWTLVEALILAIANLGSSRRSTAA